MSKRKNNFRQTLAMAMCGCDTVHLAPLLVRDDNGGYEEDPLQYRAQVCVCARDGRQPTYSIPTCAEMLLKADAALDALARFIKTS